MEPISQKEGNAEREIDGARQEPRPTGRARLLPSRDSSCNQWFCLPRWALGDLGGEPGLWRSSQPEQKQATEHTEDIERQLSVCSAGSVGSVGAVASG